MRYAYTRRFLSVDPETRIVSRTSKRWGWRCNVVSMNVDVDVRAVLQKGYPIQGRERGRERVIFESGVVEGLHALWGEGLAVSRQSVQASDGPSADSISRESLLAGISVCLSVSNFAPRSSTFSHDWMHENVYDMHSINPSFARAKIQKNVKHTWHRKMSKRYIDKIFRFVTSIAICRSTVNTLDDKMMTSIAWEAQMYIGTRMKLKGNFIASLIKSNVRMEEIASLQRKRDEKWSQDSCLGCTYTWNSWICWVCYCWQYR